MDARHKGPRLIPAEEPEHWRVLGLEALGDGLGEAVITVALERAKPEGERSQGVIERQGGKVASALAALDGAAESFRDPITVGEIAVACALGYMELRNIAEGWRDNHAALADWYRRMEGRLSFAETAPEA